MDTKKLKNLNKIDFKIPGLRIISKIGDGGMSVVYLAEQISLKRKVAVKVMRIEIAKNDLDVQRFKHEAKTIAQLDHPNIINIYNIGQTSKGEIFFTMPYLNHGNFSDYALEDESEFIRLLMSICDGLGFAHQHGVIHRDIKPENLLFDKFGNIQIADFGIAVSKDGARITQEHQIVGSAQYMSPEQARSLAVGPQTDVYSLGIVMYEKLTGIVPFSGDEGISILIDHVSTEPPKLLPQIRHWQKIIDKCLAKIPEERYQSVSELKKALATIPTNALQRTNESIQHVLTSNAKKHLKWFIPSLLLLLAAVFLLKKTPENTDAQPIELDTIKPVVIQPKQKENTVFTVVEQKKPQTDLIQTNTPNSIIQVILNDSFDANKDVIPQIDTIGNIDLSVQENLEELLSSAFDNIKKYQLSRPKENNATDQLLQVLEIDSENSLAIDGIENIGGKYYQLIKNALIKYKFNTALKHSKSLVIFNEKTRFLNRKNELQSKSLVSTIEKLDTSSKRLPVEEVKSLTQIVKTINPNSSLIAKLNSQVQFQLENRTGDTLLKVVETTLINNNLAASTTEITLEQYKEFSQKTNRATTRCKQKGAGRSFFAKKTWEKHFFTQNGNHPVVCITQADASAYAKWLSDETGNNYRLPTKDEWLLIYANADKNFNACQSGNLAGKEASETPNKQTNFACNDNYKYTAPVANFSKQKNGIYDIHGNASEWLACSSVNCNTAIALGSSWHHGKQPNVSILEEKYKPGSAYSHIGFRVVSDL